MLFFNIFRFVNESKLLKYTVAQLSLNAVDFKIFVTEYEHAGQV